MYQKWYIDIDEVFHSQNLRLTQNIVDVMNYKRGQYEKKGWPKNSYIPSLPETFQLFQYFVKKIIKKCETMNIIYQFIWIEKFYAQDFWKNKERISASLVRFYILIQKFYTIIEELFSINAYLMNQNMANFEKFNAKILKTINQGNNFLTNSEFEQQKYLISNFIASFCNYIKGGIWKIKIKKLHIPSLFQYIKINNDIEKLKDKKIFEEEEEYLKRKKSSIYTNSSTDSFQRNKAGTKSTFYTNSKSKRKRCADKKMKSKQKKLQMLVKREEERNVISERTFNFKYFQVQKAYELENFGVNRKIYIDNGCHENAWKGGEIIYERQVIKKINQIIFD